MSSRVQWLPIAGSLIQSIIMLFAFGLSTEARENPARDGEVLKRVIHAENGGKNLLRLDAWRPWGKGFQMDGKQIVCDNGSGTGNQRGATQSVRLNQKKADPIVASVWSRCEAITGSPDSNYALYLDLIYTDGDHLWGQAARFDTGTHTWQQRHVVIVPDKPVAAVSFYLLLRGHGGKAWFRDPELRQQAAPEGAALFDGIPVISEIRPAAGFQVRDVAADSHYVAIRQQTLGLKLQVHQQQTDNATFFDVVLTDTTGTDRAITLLYTIAVDPNRLTWLKDPRRAIGVEPGSEYMTASRFQAGSNGRLSKYPLAAVASSQQGTALGIDMARPAFYRLGYNSATRELFLAYDIGLAPEKPTAHVRFCRLMFEPKAGFRGALARYYALFPHAFQRRVTQQGLWMPFAKISKVEGWQDFGFVFKEGANETGWDDQHGITTFRYTEPMTWWMQMRASMPRTLEAARRHAKQLAEQKSGPPLAKVLVTSGFHDEHGRPVALLRNEPWCDGAVWSLNSMPGIVGDITDFKVKWNPEVKQRYYGADHGADLDGEYIDSCEGYVTAQLDFRREHFSAARTPLCFSMQTHKPAIFRGLIAFEYARGLAKDIHAMNKLMMANSTPSRLCWIAPLLDVMGTETDWNRGKWQPMTDEDMLYRRAMCKTKPYCFLMNTRFENFSHALVEKYMKRALAYGMFPGFFSHNASHGHYFTRPALYNRDRPLFKKFIPLCRLVAEAGWEPLTEATSSEPRVYVERFGKRYFTVLNDSGTRKHVTVQLQCNWTGSCQELVNNRTMTCKNGLLELTLEADDAVLLDIGVAKVGK